jgi:mannosyl-oligosaccharide glucosidase
MEGYGWNAYDTRFGGSQTLHDKKLHLDLDTDFIKVGDGERWAVRVTGTPRPGGSDKPNTVIIFHVAGEAVAPANAASFICVNPNSGSQNEEIQEPACQGNIPPLKPFKFRVVSDPRNIMKSQIAVNSLQISKDRLWQAKCKGSFQ